jgi:hypothetical protein
LKLVHRNINALSAGPKQSTIDNNNTGNQHNVVLHHRNPNNVMHYTIQYNSSARRRTQQERTDERGKRMVPPRRNGMDCAVLCRTELNACNGEEAQMKYEITQRKELELTGVFLCFEHVETCGGLCVSNAFKFSPIN